jgi:hypothetical protein
MTRHEILPNTISHDKRERNTKPSKWSNRPTRDFIHKIAPLEKNTMIGQHREGFFLFEKDKKLPQISFFFFKSFLKKKKTKNPN